VVQPRRSMKADGREAPRDGSLDLVLPNLNVPRTCLLCCSIKGGNLQKQKRKKKCRRVQEEKANGKKEPEGGRLEAWAAYATKYMAEGW
jgi:hypothetical protein